MPFYPVVPPDVTSDRGEDATAELPGRAGMVAVRVADLASPARRGLGKDGRSALVAAGAGKIANGDLLVFCKPVAVAAAAVRRGGRVQAAGHPADHARQGVAEERLDVLCGRPGVIDELARAVTLKGKVKGQVRRAMTPGLAIRFVLLMTLMPADYAEVMAALIGDLAGVPWRRPCALPTATVASAWREAIGPEPLEQLRDMLLAAIDAGHRVHDYRAVIVGDLDVHSIDGADRIRHHIDELFARGRPLPEILEDVARLGAQLLMQAALEAEVTEFPGRDRYQRAETCEAGRPGSRNGYREVTVKTTAGPVGLSRPKLRGTTEAFASRLFGAHVTKTNAPESLVIASFIRGLSVRDAGATLADALGDQAAISRPAVSAVCQAIKDEYQVRAQRPLGGVRLDYLFLDASFFRMHPGSPAEPVLAARGITTDGKPAFIGLAPGTGESFDAWHGFPDDLKNRGLASPLLVISDGAAGLIGAIEQAFPAVLRQRCIIHRVRNLLAKIPAGMQAEVKDAYRAIFDTEDLKAPPGPGLEGIIDARISEFAARYQTLYPAAAKVVLTDREGLTACLRFPREHHHRIRHSSFIERTFGETRRRARVIGRLPGETSCLTLVRAVLDRASRGWRGLTMTAGGLRLLQDLRRSLLEPPAQLRPRTVTDAQPKDHPETVRATA